ncbi:MAG: inositol monophosphatase [Pseudomonadota bacterium]|nr:inositol monophosphatase [Pseudomonadota bacterium]
MDVDSSFFAQGDRDSFLEAAIDAAQAGGQVIREGAPTSAQLAVERKNLNDFVSAIDKGSERAIIDVLSARFPSHAFHGEESGHSGVAEAPEFVWLIDPLDGTTNFLHGFPHYCVSIALKVGAEIEVGVVFDPLQGRLFTAKRGAGAYLNGERIGVSSRSGLTEALICTGLPFTDWSFLDDYLASLRVIMQRCGGVRRAGAAALDLAFVAAGWLDGFWEKNLNAWDVGAGSLLVQEAGGAVSDFSGAEGFLDGGQMIAGPTGVHRELVEVLRGYPAMCAPRR